MAFLFLRKAALRGAGLQRISFSLDSLDRDNWKRMTGRDEFESARQHRAGTELALTPVKVMPWCPRAQRSRDRTSCRFARDHRLPLHRVHAAGLQPLLAEDSSCRGGDSTAAAGALGQARPSSNGQTARRWAFADGRGDQDPSASERAVLRPLQPDSRHGHGKIRTCLFSIHEHDLKSTMRRPSGGDRRSTARYRVAKEGHHIGEPESCSPPGR
jgi:cyclic pyranopterin phosphate synthase